MTTGILEAIMTETDVIIIGEIRDEHEPDSDVKEDGNGGYIVSGSFDLGRLVDLVDTFQPEEEICLGRPRILPRAILKRSTNSA